jgi:glutaredoxin
MEQQCHLSMVWLTWLGLPALAVVVGVRLGWIAGVVVLGAGVVAELAYLRSFPALSRLMGYGSVADVPADRVPAPSGRVRVILYTANVCPFCPIVRRRLEALRERVPFDLFEVDVTFRPRVIRDKGLRSVPVVEANGRFLVGNATTEQLAGLVTAAGTPGAVDSPDPAR